MAKLYIVGTPIGNLEVLTPRAKRVLAEVDFIAAEDTRVTLKLLNHFQIKTEILSYYEHNKKEKGEYIINRILSGESCALVTDAGMPAISDPGEDLVREARKLEIPIESVPGPSALITALCVSGMPSSRFCFEGFLPVDKKVRKERLSEIKGEKRTMIFYEAPHKLLSTLSDLSENLGERQIAVAKELTKIHETVLIFTLPQAVEYFKDNTPKGEYVLIIEGETKTDERTYTLSEAVNLCKKLMDSGLSASAAAKEVAQITNFKKGEIYSSMLQEKQ
ncbi:MAG: 16S rRNA (cytidine(1402)-2'-O)-methyltransferase [Clostridia bacterium]|nr:16S rRNA (cytidine(1402)-2'-O)-methyltransferase [Clostridia bacterium]